MSSPPPQLKFLPTDLPGVIRIEPAIYGDARGFFVETWHEEKYRRGGIDTRFVQDNHSLSSGGTLRGLHLQLSRPQGKLVRAIEGCIRDIAVDVRRGSPHFGRWIAVELSAENCHQLWVPPGFAHGFAALTERVQVEYKVTEFYDPEDELTIAWDDPDLAIDWLVSAPILSAKDRSGKALASVTEQLPRFPGMQRDETPQGEAE